MRQKILDVIEEWDQSVLTEDDVHRFAETLIENLDDYEKVNSVDLIASEVLVQLDAMDYQLITKTDIPAIIEFLKTSKDNEKEAWKLWMRYWETIDLDLRKGELKTNPFYNT